MLNGTQWLNSRILDRPSLCWWDDRLWVGYIDLAGIVQVAAVDVRQDPAPVAAATLPLISPFGPAVTGFRSNLIVAVTDPTVSVSIFASSDGVTFGPPVVLPFPAINQVALAAAEYLWLAWVDTNRDLHIARSNDAVNFQDAVTPFTVAGSPALAGLKETGAIPMIAVAWREALVDDVTISTFAEAVFDENLPQRRGLGESGGVDAVGVTFVAGHKDSHRRIVVGCERQDPPRNHARDHHLFARQLPSDLTSAGGQETAVSGLGPALARGFARNWVAWRDTDNRNDFLAIAPYDVVFALPPELEALVGTPCEPDHCPPDLRLACVATEDFTWRDEPGWIRNARKGDLVVTPASGTGIIGGFLQTLRYPQKFDHMGIMLRDHDLVRHTTMAHERLKHRTTGELLGEPAPLDGHRVDCVKYGWPGTITQSVQNGFFDGFNDGENPLWMDQAAPPPPPWPGPGASPVALDAFSKAERLWRGFVDPELLDGVKTGYAFHNLTWLPQLRPDGELVEPIVVKPLPALEAENPDLRTQLHRVADAANRIRGHYRFYCYSQAAGIGPLWAPKRGDPSWANVPPGGDWAADTPPMVCSTFIWEAVLAASAAGFPKLRLEDAPEATPEEGYRAQQNVIYDGLYRYHADERATAAQALYDYCLKTVHAEVWSRLQKVKSEQGGWLVNALGHGLAGTLLLLSMPVAALGALLGISVENAGKLIVALNDMPDDVANQLVNAFASDRADSTDKLWDPPGEGVTVSPHDIAWLWDPPQAPAPGVHPRVGLWGHVERLILPAPRPEYRRKFVYGRAGGLASVRGSVLYRGAPVVGAQVRIGCEETMTGPRGRYEIEVPASSAQEIVGNAYWQPGWWLDGRRVEDLAPGTNPDFDIVLEDPPEWRRVMRLSVKIDLVSRTLVGNDDWTHLMVNVEHRFTRAPAAWGDPPGGTLPLKVTGSQVITDYADDVRGRLLIDAEMDPADLSIQVTLTAEIVEGHKRTRKLGASGPLTLLKDGTDERTFKFKTAEASPDRAWFEVKGWNLVEMA